MTWMNNESDASLPINKLITDDNRPGAELAPGVMIERRRWLWLPALTAAAFALNPQQLLAQGMTQTSPGNTTANKNQSTAELGWDEFLKQCLPTAEELHRDLSKRGQDAYLHWLASMITRLRLKEMPRAKLGRFGTLNPPVHFGVSFRSNLFFIVEWWMEPGAVLPAHCHPNASACTMGLEGEARIRNFEIIGEAPAFSSKQTFHIRETHSEVIAPGRINTLSALRDNIHTFQAGKQGARGVDISSYHGPDVGFSFLDFGDKPRDAEQRIYEAAWKKL
jgi:hypothetical protein